MHIPAHVKCIFRLQIISVITHTAIIYDNMIHSFIFSSLCPTHYREMITAATLFASFTSRGTVHISTEMSSSAAPITMSAMFLWRSQPLVFMHIITFSNIPPRFPGMFMQGHTIRYRCHRCSSQAHLRHLHINMFHLRRDFEHLVQC